MTEVGAPSTVKSVEALEAELVRLNKVLKALMDRAERSTKIQSSDFNLFQTAILLEEQVQQRTSDLANALRENEKITRDLQQAKEHLEEEIQHRIEVQNDLQTSEERYRVATEAALDAVLTLDEDFRIVFANSATENVFGYSGGELISHSLGMLMPAELQSAHLDAIREHILSESGMSVTRTLQLACRHRNGADIEIEFSFGKFNHRDKVFYACIARNITERIQAERRVQSLQDKLREQAVRDPLTGVFNRHYLAETFDRELSRAQRENVVVSLVMGDIDFFKTINDSYGHLAGDQVLKEFAGLLAGRARASDIVCRFGGEEFLLVLPGLDEAGAWERAEQLRQAIEQMTVHYGGNAISATVSFGVSVFPQHGRTIEELVSAADQALYYAKSHGRNQVQTYSSIGG